MKYRKKPVVINAIQLLLRDKQNAGELDKIFKFLNMPEATIETPGGGFVDAVNIPTLEGSMKALPGDWIIRGIEGEVYPCKPDIFEATYEVVEGVYQ